VTGVDVLITAVLVAWLACGLAAVALAPHNGAARWLLAAALLLGGSAVTDVLAPEAGTDLAFALLRTAGWMSFLGAVAAIVGTLVRLPDGTPDRPWQARMATALVVLAVAAPLLELVGSPELAVDEDTAPRPNPLAVDALRPLATLGAAVRLTEPAWVLAGVVLLLLRWWRGDAERRRELAWALRSVALLAVLLTVIVLVEVSGAPHPPDALFQPVFFLALALFPGTLLWGITERVRALESRLLESRARLVEAEDRARRQLERDLHDGVQQQLVGALLLVTIADRQVAGRPDAARTTIAEVGDRLRQSMEDLRELLRGIRPAVLDDAGLVPAIESRLARLPVEVQLEADERAAGRWPPAVESAAYFVVSEAVTNAMKHAPGSRVRVRLTAPDGALVAEVADDGPGLDGAGTGSGGLRGLRDRVESLRGRLEVCGRPGEGTVVRACFPAGTHG
jgi:signal transduction histidine kinase